MFYTLFSHDALVLTVNDENIFFLFVNERRGFIHSNSFTQNVTFAHVTKYFYVFFYKIQILIKLVTLVSSGFPPMVAAVVLTFRC